MRLPATVIFVFLSFLSTSIYAQKKDDLEKKKAENIQKVQETKKILAQTTSKKKTTLGALSALNQQIKVRADLINSIDQEIDLIDGEIKEIEGIIHSLENDLGKLRDEYARMIFSAYKANQGYDKLVFLFSAKSFNQFLMRLKYLEQYTTARKNQARQIELVKQALVQQKESLVNKQNQKQALLDEQLDENKNLIALKKKQNNLIIDLTKKEKQLRQELEERRQAIARLDKLIAELVRAEIERRKRSEATGARTLSADAAALSSSFAENRSRLDWPVDRGFISRKFGRQPHPVLKGIQIENRGIDIQTQKDEPVKSIFNGEVTTIAFVPGMNNVVLVKHGEFFTLYAKLKNVKVKKGQKIKAYEPIGEVYTNQDGVSELQFQVWKNNQKLDPEKWLRGR